MRELKDHDAIAIGKIENYYGLYLSKSTVEFLTGQLKTGMDTIGSRFQRAFISS
jgi:hypothetical protein